MLEEEKLLQENANLAVISKLINSSLNKTVQDTIISMFGDMQQNDAILISKRIPLVCERIAAILKNQEEVKVALAKKEDDFEARIRKLERNQAWYMGAAAIIASLGTLAVQHFWH